MSIKQAAKEERQKFHEIKGFSKKAGYIWDYYRYWIIGTIAAIAFCISIGGSIYHNIKYTQIFYCAIFNNPLTDEALVSLETDFGAYYNLNPKNETMHFDSTYVISEDGDPQTNYVTIQKIGAMVASILPLNYARMLTPYIQPKDNNNKNANCQYFCRKNF